MSLVCTYTLCMNALNNLRLHTRHGALTDCPRTRTAATVCHRLASLGLLALILSVACTQPSPAQLSGWASANYGYSSNPLRTYEEASDHVTQFFLQLSSGDPADAGRVAVSYIGGFTLFNSLIDRNYFEQALRISSLTRYGTPPAAAADTADEEDGENLPGDTLRPYLLLGLNVGTRHDRETFKTYDNQGFSFAVNYRTSAAVPLRLLVSNILEYRNYSYIHELSNLTNATTLRLEDDPGGPAAFGAIAGLSVKYYPVATYDTSQFETKRTFAGKSAGKGKGGGNVQSRGQQKQILINPQDQTALQVQTGLFAIGRWNSGSLEADGIYRFNPGPTPRYLAQYANPSTLHEDIYGDYMEYHGPELNITFRQKLPLGIRAAILGQIRRSTYGAPALDLAGNETAASRLDSRGSLDITLSRYLETASGIGFELGITSTILRNQSNDEYNDYSLFAISVELGIGF